MITEEVRLWKLTRRHVRERLEQGLIKGAILPTGSTEQHNEHLTMEHDTASAAHVAYQAALQLYPQTVVATPMAMFMLPSVATRGLTPRSATTTPLNRPQARASARPSPRPGASRTRAVTHRR